ncbi:MAG TPA: thioester reductase domain-containing protein [Actinospica sp.]|jgi:thioester reductase-like protein|nr:thioester reductase domain-containing protein [Actinospica sp.]
MLLLTGATGFLGSRLCAELLRRTDRDVVCLVRADTAAHADRRMRERLAARDPEVADSPRLRTVPGDMTAPRLGLSRAGYADLVASVTDVYHCGASVNMAGSHRRLAAVNAAGTSRVIAFCEAPRSGGSARLHHVSTLSVFLAARGTGWHRVPERAMPTARTCGDFGYPRSKYDAEMLVAERALHGLPAVIYRPGLILADSRDGVCPHDDFIACLFAAAIATGRFPETDNPLPVIAVDHAARMIAALSLSARTRPGLDVFPVIQPEPLRVRELSDHVRRHGYEVAAADAAEWLSALKRSGDERSARAMRALTISRYLLGLSADTRLPDLECAETAKACAEAGITAPLMDHDYFSRALRHLAEHGVIPHPSPARSLA